MLSLFVTLKTAAAQNKLLVKGGEWTSELYICPSFDLNIEQFFNYSPINAKAQFCKYIKRFRSL